VVNSTNASAESAPVSPRGSGTPKSPLGKRSSNPYEPEESIFKRTRLAVSRQAFIGQIYQILIDLLPYNLSNINYEALAELIAQVDSRLHPTVISIRDSPDPEIGPLPEVPSLFGSPPKRPKLIIDVPKPATYDFGKPSDEYARERQAFQQSINWDGSAVITNNEAIQDNPDNDDAKGEEAEHSQHNDDEIDVEEGDRGNDEEVLEVDEWKDPNKK
nr:hypothetical protein [Candidatus Dojkabacteria bacterium]